MSYFDSSHMSETLLPAFKAVLTAPRAFFSGMPTTDKWRHSLVLLTIVSLLGLLLSAPFYGFLTLLLMPFMWLFVMISIWLWAAYLSWAVRTFTAQRLDTVNAFQLSAYAYVPLLFGFLPMLGLIANLWSIYLTWLGLVTKVGVRDGVALMIIIVPILFLILSMVLLVVLLFTLMPDMMHMEIDQTMQF